MFVLAVGAAVAAAGLVLQFLLPVPGPQQTLLVTAAVTAAVVVAATVTAAVVLDKRRFRDYGLHVDVGWIVDFVAGLALGALLMTLVFIVEVGAGWATVEGVRQVDGPLSFRAAFATVAAATLLFALAEELAVRGYLFTNLSEGFRFLGAVPAVVLATLLSAGLFAALHVVHPDASLLGAVGIALLGVLLAVAYVLTGDVALSAGIYASWNLFQGPIYGFNTNGLDPGVSVLTVSQSGPVAVTGGPFGPGAGLVGVGATLLGSLAVVAYARRRHAGTGFSPVVVPELRWWTWASPVEPVEVSGGDTVVFEIDHPETAIEGGDPVAASSGRGSDGKTRGA